jgi:hypothetical protein
MHHESRTFGWANHSISGYAVELLVKGIENTLVEHYGAESGLANKDDGRCKQMSRDGQLIRRCVSRSCYKSIVHIRLNCEQN